MAAHDRRIGFAGAFEMRQPNCRFNSFCDRGKLNMARPRAPDGADTTRRFLHSSTKSWKVLDRRILLHAELPADHAPAVDRREVERLVARAPDHLVDGGARRGLRHHHVAVWPGGEELAARDPSACAQHIFELGLDPLLLEIGLDHARGGVDRSARRLIDDPVDVARPGNFPAPRLGTPRDPTAPAAAAPSAALPALTNKPRRSIRQMPAHLRAPVARACSVRRRQPNPDALFQRMFDTRSVPAQRPATQDR